MSKLAKAFWGFFCFFLVLVLAAIIVPNMLWLTIKANEESAVQSLEKLRKVEDLYRKSDPEHGFTCSLQKLGNVDSEFRWDGDIGWRAGYVFTLSDCKTVMTKVVGYKLYAVPQAIGHTGTKGFCNDEQGKAMVDPKGGTHCTEPR